jgi:hypothetical protein
VVVVVVVVVVVAVSANEVLLEGCKQRAEQLWREQEPTMWQEFRDGFLGQV